MREKARVVLALTLGVMLAVALGIAYAATEMPKEDILIKSDVFKDRKKSGVMFPHGKHKEFGCDQCHHVYKDGKNVFKEGDEVQKCGACHKEKKTDGVPKLYKAAHDQCLDCHRKLRKERGKDKSGPTSCKDCHPKKKKN